MQRFYVEIVGTTVLEKFSFKRQCKNEEEIEIVL
jgi:hypothetical protein